MLPLIVTGTLTFAVAIVACCFVVHDARKGEVGQVAPCLCLASISFALSAFLFFIAGSASGHGKLLNQEDLVAGEHYRVLSSTEVDGQILTLLADRANKKRVYSFPLSWQNMLVVSQWHQAEGENDQQRIFCPLATTKAIDQVPIAEEPSSSSQPASKASAHP